MDTLFERIEQKYSKFFKGGISTFQVPVLWFLKKKKKVKKEQQTEAEIWFRLGRGGGGEENGYEVLEILRF